ncbi:CHAT domain-containing tetratricopeptide repeat protein [Streptomyces spectabilis]|uniref:CHAT domain-containing protein n=1 Tax=Streptomyces spectabilis TaxID=68270 RepID=UPI0033E4198B
MGIRRRLRAEVKRVDGVKAAREGRWQAARDDLTLALEALTAEGLDGELHKVLEPLVTACMMAGLLDEAERRALDYRAWAADHGSPEDRATALGKYGEAVAQIGRLVEAAEAFREALVALGEPGDETGRELRWSLLSNLGSALAHAGRFGDAEQVQHRAFEVARELDSAPRAALAASQLSLAANGVGHRERALEWAEVARGWMRSDDDDLVVAEVEGNRALALSRAGHTDEAEEAMRRAWAAARHIPLLAQQAQVTNLEVLSRAGRHEEAVAMADALLAALPPGQPRQRAVALNLRAGIRLQGGRPAEAVADLESALELKQRIADHRGMATGHLNLAHAFLGAGDLPSARHHARRAEELWAPLLRAASDEAGSVGLFDVHATALTQVAQELRLGVEDVTGALEAAERGRSGPLSERIRAARPARAQVPAEPPGSERMQRLARRLGATLLVYAPHFEIEAVSGQAPRLREIHMWVVAPDGGIHHEVQREVTDEGRLDESPPVDLLDAVRQLESQVGDAALMAGWAEVLLGKVARLLPEGPTARLVIVPQRGLWSVPFAALPVGSGEPLISRCSLTLVPSLHALELIAHDDVWRDGEREPGTSGPLVVGGVRDAVVPTPDGRLLPLSDLPLTLETARAVAHVHGGSALAGPAATVPAVLDRMGSADLLHFSCHAVLDARLRLDQLPGCIALTPAGDEHGQLTSTLLASTPTRARIAVLGCCATGQGLVTADGVLGLARTFLMSGVSTVLATLWEVPEEPTHDALVCFHQELALTGDPAEALRRAVLTTRRKWRAPEIWAAFTLVGSPGPRRRAE